jgi:hypothetical protein
MTAGIYLLCAATCLVCAVFLLRGYSRSGVRLLLWSGLCFVGLMLENVLGYVDVAIIPDVSLAVFRKLPGLLAISLLLFGLIWESK